MLNNKIILLILVAVIFIGGFFYSNYKNRLFEKKFIEVAFLNDTGKYSESQSTLKKSIKEYPEEISLKLSLANSYLNEGNDFNKQQEKSKMAQEILFELTREGYENSYLYDLLAYSYEIVNKFDKATEYYNKSLSINPNNPNSLFGKGHILDLKGQNEEALALYKKAEENLKNETDNSIKIKVYMGMGRMLYLLNSDYQKATDYYKKAIPLTINRDAKSELFFNLGEISINHKNNLEEALDYAKNAIKTDPSNELGYILYGKVAVLDEGYEEMGKAAEYLLKALFLNPNRALADYWQGQFFLKIGEKDDAKKHYDIALNDVPNDITLSETAKKQMKADIYMAKLAINMAEENLEKAEVNMKKALELDPIKTFYIIQNTEELKVLESLLN